MSDLAVLSPKEFSHGGIILAKGQLDNSYNYYYLLWLITLLGLLRIFMRQTLSVNNIGFNLKNFWVSMQLLSETYISKYLVVSTQVIEWIRKSKSKSTLPEFILGGLFGDLRSQQPIKK